jgi:SAM-dependent methyltransferase
MKKLYDHELCDHGVPIHNTTASGIIVPELIRQFQPQSILDVGCGLGTWLLPFYENNILDLVGLDSDYVDMQQLVIPQKFFIPTDLRQPFDLKRKFDLLLSLEVAEHLPESCADDFVQSLVKHSDVIIFSAAIPHQGGQNHLNEQGFEYWDEKFKKQGYVMHDYFRPKYWKNKMIEPWYRQNMMLVLKQGLEIEIEPAIFTAYHPELLLRTYDNTKNANRSVAIAIRFLGANILRKIGVKKR